MERGKDYNHSTFCDLVISGLIGLRPRSDDTVEVNPLVPPSWDYFCLDQIPYHGLNLTILFDKTGSHYGKGKGLRVFADGKANRRVGEARASRRPIASIGAARNVSRLEEVRRQSGDGREIRDVL